MFNLHDFLEYIPLTVMFSTPQMPIFSPPSPSISADAEKMRLAAADKAQTDASSYGRASTVHAGTEIAYKEAAGKSLMRGSVSTSMGL